MNELPTVAVVGTGTMGAMTAWQLARRGVPVVAFDAYAPGHDRGAAGGESRIFRTAYREGAQYVPLLQRAQQLWHELEQETGSALLTLSGGLTVGPRDNPDVREVLAGDQEFGLGCEVLEGAEAAERFPDHPLAADEIIVLDRQAGVLRPELAVHAAAQAAQRHGAVIRLYTPVRSISADADRVVVHAADGDHEFDHVVLAPGPWAAKHELLDFVPLEVQQITTCWFPAKQPKRHLPEHTPIAIRIGELAFSCFPAMDGISVKVSVHHVDRPRLGTADDLPRTASDEVLHAARTCVAEVLPALHGEPIRIGTYADCFSPDGHALVGRLPGQPNVTVLAGFSGHGFKLAPAIGAVTAADVLDDGGSAAVPHLDPARFR